MKTFKEESLSAIEELGTPLCAGIDFAEYEMGRGEKGLPQGVNKRDAILKYIEAISPYCAFVKPNLQYNQAPGNLTKYNENLQALRETQNEFTDFSEASEQIPDERPKPGDMELLVEISDLASTLGLVVIEDKKLADIGSTNDAGMFYASYRANAVTLALFAGNMQEAAKQLKKRNLGGIHMCLMTNPQYADEKLSLKPIKPEHTREYQDSDVHWITPPGETVKQPYVLQFIKLAHEANKFGLDGLVIGTTKHITSEEIAKARQYAGPEMFALVPGIGDQGGEAQQIWEHFATDRAILNVGRSLMFPKGSNSTPEDQRDKAKYFADLFNKLRAEAR